MVYETGITDTGYNRHSYSTKCGSNEEVKFTQNFFAQSLGRLNRVCAIFTAAMPGIKFLQYLKLYLL